MTDPAIKNFRKEKLSHDQVRQWLFDLRENAYVPESGYAVASVFRVRCGVADDYYFGGVNVENMDHRLATHGEEGAIAAIVAAFGKKAEIVEGWIVGAPVAVMPGDDHPSAKTFASCCGKCRQQIAGLADEKAPIHYLSLSGGRETTTVSAFLPELFTFRQFIPGFATEKNAGNSLSALEIRKRFILQGPLPDQEIGDWLKGLESVDYATKVSQSIVLRLDNDFYVAGTRIEEAAFVDINAAQAAVAISTAAFGARKIKEAWVYTRGRDGKQLAAGTVGTLPLSALQVLLEFAVDEALPIHYLGDGGVVLDKTLLTAAQVAPVTGKPFLKV